MIELSVRAPFGRLERSLAMLSGQMRFAAATAINDCARAGRDRVNGRMGETFDRPTPFTQRAVVAPRELAASKASLQATVTVRPLQAKYLLHEEVGGTRAPAENTRRAGAAIVLPGRGLLLDQYGGIPRGTLKTLKAQAKPSARTRAKRAAQGAAAGSVVFLARAAAANKAGIGGYFRRGPGHTLQRLTAFASVAHYQPRFHYQAQVRDAAVAAWPSAFRRRLTEAIRTAR